MTSARLVRVLAFATILALATFGELIALIAVVTFRALFAVTRASRAFVMWRRVCILCRMRLRDFLSVCP